MHDPNAGADNAKWIMDKLHKPSIWWHVWSAIVFGATALFLKIFLGYFNKTTVYNKEILIKALDERPTGTPLITVANHYSVFDDPAIWSLLPFRQMSDKSIMRWGLAAQDFCFTEKPVSLFLMYGKAIPVFRGGGVHQPAVDFCIDKLKRGEWVHVFPEAKINVEKTPMRVKWGVGRMVYEMSKMPIVIPIFHLGLDEILPNEPWVPYKLHRGKKITIKVGEPIDLNPIMDHVRNSKMNEIDARKYITDKIQDAIYDLGVQTLPLHQK